MRSLALFLLALIVALPASSAADDDDKPAIRWTHPWLPRRYFDYRHKRWAHIKEADLGVLVEDATERYTYDGAGGFEHHQSYTMRVRQPAALPEFLPIVNKSPLRETEIGELELRWESAGRTRVYGVADLLESNQAPFAGYITDEVALVLPLDRSKPGTLHVSVTTREGPHPGFEAYIGGVEFLQPGPYTKSRTLIIEVPQGEPLAFATRFFSLPQMPAAEPLGAHDRYTFTFETLYQRFGEPAMPHAMDSFPSLAWSNQPSWERLASLASARWEPELDASEAMTEWAAELVAGHEDLADRALAIHDAVAEGWDYLGFYPSASGWVPHGAQHCYAARIGDCKDKTALMVTLMRAVGIDAWPALVVAGTPYELTEVPTLGFNHAIVAVTDPSHPDGVFFLDSVDAGVGARPAGPWIQDRDALVLRPEGGGLVHVPALSAERWLEQDDTVIALDEDGVATADLTWRFVGRRANERLGRRGRTDPQRWEQELRRSILAAWPGAEILALEEGRDPQAPTDAWLVTARLRSVHLVSRAGPHLVIRLPWLHDRDPSRLLVDAGRRVHPVVLDPLLERSTVRVQLPPGAQVVALPEALQEERDDWQASLSASADGAGAVQVTLQVQELPGRMDAGLEEARRNFARAVRDAQERPIIVRVGG